MMTWIQLQAFVRYVERYVAERAREEIEAEARAMEARAAAERDGRVRRRPVEIERGPAA